MLPASRLHLSTRSDLVASVRRITTKSGEGISPIGRGRRWLRRQPGCGAHTLTLRVLRKCVSTAYTHTVRAQAKRVSGDQELLRCDSGASVTCKPERDTLKRHKNRRQKPAGWSQTHHAPVHVPVGKNESCLSLGFFNAHLALVKL